MMDLSLSKTGDLILNKNDFNLINKDKLRFQKVYCLLKSAKNNWFQDKFGADLELFMGTSINKENIKKITSTIKEEILKYQFYETDEIYIEILNDNNILEIKVYLRKEDGLSSDVINLDLDLVRGINVRLGVD